MPRSSNGTYTLPQAAFVTLTVISSAAMNSNLSDIATALTGSLAINGSTIMTAPFVASGGTAALPSVTFVGALTSGLYLAGANQIGMSTNGILSQTWNSDQSVTFAGNIAAVGGAFSGAVSGTTGTFTGAVTGASAVVTGALQSSSTTSAGVGYTSGARGAVTQLTNKTTAVTLNKLSGNILLAAGNIAANSGATFQLNNTLLGANDALVLSWIHDGVSTTSAYVPTSEISNASAQITVRNVTAGGLNETPTLTFIVIKG